jgi:hypothetical protein
MDLFINGLYTSTNDRGHAADVLPRSSKSKTSIWDIVPNSSFAWARKADEASAAGNDERAIEFVEFAFCCRRSRHSCIGMTVYARW